VYKPEKEIAIQKTRNVGFINARIILRCVKRCVCVNYPFSYRKCQLLANWTFPFDV